MNDQEEVPQTISGWPVVVDPDSSKIKELVKTGFTGIVYYKEYPGRLPWAIWHSGELRSHKTTQDDAKAEIERIAGSRD